MTSGVVSATTAAEMEPEAMIAQAPGLGSVPVAGQLSNSPPKGRLRAMLPVVTIAAIGLIQSAVASAFVWQWEERIARRELTAMAESHFLALQNGLNEYLNKLVAVRALFESSTEVTREEFETFSSRLLSGQMAIQNFSWVPLVTRDGRAQHEAAGVQQGLSGYRIKAVLPDDSIVTSPQRDEYLPIFFSTVERQSRIYGIDLLSQPAIRRPLERARDLDQLSAVPDFILHSRDGHVHGFLFSLPVYRQDRPNTTVAERRANLRGFAHGAFVTAEAIDHILNTTSSPRGLDLYVYLADASPAALPVHVHSSRLRKDAAQPEPRWRLMADRHVAGQLRAGDARWDLVAVPLAGSPVAARHDRAWLLLISGLIVTLIATLYTRLWVRHTQRLQQANEEIFSLAQRDVLTGLANRRAFNDRLAEVFGSARHSEGRFAVLYFDLDHFKDVNDTLGHPVGDRLLKMVADRVQSIIRTSDMVARFGGDEFAVLQTDADGSAAATIAERINEILAEPFAIDGSEIHITASIGIALSDPKAATADEVIVHADLALYRAKQEGRNCFRFHSAELDREVRDRVVLAEELRNALGNGELRLRFQPQVELRSGRIVGAEALLRWQHPRLGSLEPSKFIPAAERAGLIGALGEWAFEQACRQMSVWHERGLAPDILAIDLFASQIKSGEQLERLLRTVLDKYRIEPFSMEVELTESVLMSVTVQHGESLQRLRDLGLRIAVDNFGTGCSSLSYLSRYPVTRLKIAHELVFGVTGDARKATVVRAAIRLARELGIDCIADGVESREQADFLVASGCAVGQGCYFGGPHEAERLTTLLATQRAQASPGRRPQGKPHLEVING